MVASNDRTLGARYVYDARNNKLSRLGDLTPWLPEAQMAPIEPIRYTARDGLEIPGYLTLPVGREPRNLACIVNPKRISIYGASCGGYARQARVTFTPDLYAAAVNYVGVSSLFSFLQTIPPCWEPFRAQMFEMAGNPDDPQEQARLRATSPVFHVEPIRTPLFVAQGARDPRVNKAENDQIVEAHKKQGVAVQYMVKDNEGHGFANEENQFEFYGAMESFLRQHLRP